MLDLEMPAKKPKTEADSRFIDAIESIINIYKYKSERNFLEAMEVPHSLLNKLRNGIQSVPDELVSKLAKEFKINLNYIYTGNGQMFLTELDQNANRIPLEQVESEGGIRYLPFLPVRGRATFAEFYDDDCAIKTEDVLPVPSIPDTKEYECAIVVEIDGDSMSPLLKHGHRIVATPKPQSEWIYLDAGIYVFLYRNTFVVKRIITNKVRETGTFELVSDNPLGGTATVPIDDMRAIWQGKMKIYEPL